MGWITHFVCQLYKDTDPKLDLPISDAVHQDRCTWQSRHTTLNTTVPLGLCPAQQIVGAGSLLPTTVLGPSSCFHHVVPTKTHYLLSHDEHFHSNKDARQVFGVRNYCERCHRLSNSEHCCKYHRWLYFSYDCMFNLHTGIRCSSCRLLWMFEQSYRFYTMFMVFCEKYRCAEKHHQHKIWMCKLCCERIWNVN